MKEVTQEMIEMIGSECFQSIITNIKTSVNNEIINEVKSEYHITEEKLSLINSYGNFEYILKKAIETTFSEL